MRPDVGDFVTFGGLCVVAVLLIPKVPWRSIAAHLHETASGERVYAFRPPALYGPLADDVVERWLQVLRRDWPRVLDLGVLLYVLAVLAEARGARRRRARDAAWSESASSLILDHLASGQAEDVLRERLRERGLREPAAKLTLPATREFVLPPAGWRIDWEREVAAASSPPAAAPPERAVTTPVRRRVEPVDAEFSVHTLGEIRFCHRGEDIAPRLLRQWILGYLWCYLLIREARRPGDRVLRSIVADELYPAQDPKQRTEKTRKRLSELVGKLPQPLRGCIKLESGYVGLDLSGYRFDVRELFDLVQRVEHEANGVNEETIAEIRDALVAAREEWLPGFEEIERKGSGGRGAAGEMVAEVRTEVAAAHASLLRVLADWHLSRGEAQRVIHDLEDGLRRRPDQIVITTVLVSAYEQAGQMDLAARVRREHGLGEGS
jgi:hypothetical protein